MELNKRPLNDILASILLFGCATVFLFSTCMLVLNTTKEKISYEVHFVVTTDTTGVVSTDARMLADSLILEFKKHDAMLQDKYQYVLEQKENLNDLIAYGGILVSIVLSVFGFMGYKSIKSMEDSIEGKIDMKLTAKSTSFEENNKTIISKNVEVELDNRGFVDGKSMRGALTQHINKKVQEASKKLEGIDNPQCDLNSKAIEALDREVSLLKDRIIKIEDVDGRNEDLIEPEQDKAEELDFSSSDNTSPFEIKEVKS